MQVLYIISYYTCIYLIKHTIYILGCYLRDDIRLYFFYHNSAAGYYRVCSCYIYFISYSFDPYAIDRFIFIDDGKSE